MTLKSLTEWAARNDPNGDWNEMVPLANGSDEEKKYLVECLLSAYANWFLDTDDEKQKQFLCRALLNLKTMRCTYEAV